MLKRSILKLERWKLSLWKSVCAEQAQKDIINPEDPIEPFLREYSNGLNAGLKMAVTWFEKYVEGTK